MNKEEMALNFSGTIEGTPIGLSRAHAQGRYEGFLVGFDSAESSMQERCDAAEAERDIWKKHSEDIGNQLSHYTDCNSIMQSAMGTDFAKIDSLQRRLDVACSALEKIATPSAMEIPEDDPDGAVADFWHERSYTKLNIASDALKQLRGRDVS